MENADLILCAELNDHWHPFNIRHLRETFGSKIISYNRPFVKSLHPDLTYVTPDAPKSPVGDYHSRIVIDCFLRGLPEKECVNSFNEKTYRNLNFHEIATQSLADLKERDTSPDIKISEWFQDNMRSTPLMYSINHPTMALQKYIAQSFCDRVGVKCTNPEVLLTPTQLSSSVIWPIDEDWAKIMDLNYCTGAVFWSENYMMPLDEFVWRSYQAYSALKPERILSSSI